MVHSRLLHGTLGALAIAAVATSQAAAVSFTAPAVLTAGDGPGTVVARDLNADGDLDLVSVNRFSNDVSILLGGAGASFAPATAVPVDGTFPTDVAIADFDADNDPDLAVVNAGVGTNDSTDRISILLGAGDGTFGAPATFTVDHQTQAIVAADFNADTDPDLATGHDGNSVLFVHVGGAGATFSTQAGPSVGSRPNSVVTGDFNADNDPDIATANAIATNVSIVLGGPNATFGSATNYSVAGGLNPGQGPLGLALGEFDGDGDLDVVTSNRGFVSLLKGAAEGTFTASDTIDLGLTDSSRVATGDFDGDGDPDLAVAGNNFPTYVGIAILRGSTGMTFASAEEFEVHGGPGRPAPGDFNGDGDLDLAVPLGLADGVAVLLNRAHAPAAPAFTASVPAGPANDNAPRVTGTAPAGTTVRVYTSADCSGVPAVTGTAAQFADPGLPVAVPDDSSTTFRATATNSADVPSDCSTGSLTYIEHSSPPTARLTITPTLVLTGAPVTFDASSSAGFGIVRYEWDLDGDNTFERDTGAAATTTQSYAAAADVVSRVRVTNDIGSSVAQAGVSVRLAPPPGRVGISIRDTATGELRYTNNPDVTIAVVWPPLASEMLISNDGGFTDATTRPVAVSANWRLDVQGEERLPRTVYVRFVGPGTDPASTFTDDIVLDTRPPTVTQAALAGGEGGAGARAAAQRTKRYRLRIRASDAVSGIARLQVGGSGGRRASAVRLARVARKLQRTITVRARFRPRRVRLQDAAGNWSRWKRIARR